MTGGGWSNTKVVKFLSVLKGDKMIDYFSDKKKTLLTIVNYDIYQNDKTQKRQSKDTETTQKHTNKNDKNDKNDKNKRYTQGKVKLTEIEHQEINRTQVWRKRN